VDEGGRMTWNDLHFTASRVLSDDPRLSAESGQGL
jgi:hypothetical protein